MSIGSHLPKLYVEGKDDIGVISALLFRHGLTTNRGANHLYIQDLCNIDAVLDSIPDAIKASTDRAIGFVIDIDIELRDRWAAVRTKLSDLEVEVPESCPPGGFLGQLKDYPYRFGVWLMPDCATDCHKLENLVQTLIREGDPLWQYAQRCVSEAAKIVDEINAGGGQPQWERFRDVDTIKSEMHSWLSWQRCPGVPLGAAINDHILRHDSPQAIAFLRWVKELYGLANLNLPGDAPAAV